MWLSNISAGGTADEIIVSGNPSVLSSWNSIVVGAIRSDGAHGRGSCWDDVSDVSGSSTVMNDVQLSSDDEWL